MSTTKEGRINRQYVREFLMAMAAYTITLIASIWLVGMIENQWLKWLIAVLPIIPIGFALRAFLRYLAQTDEYLQRIQLQAIGFAAGATGIVTFTLGLLENVGFPSVPMVWVLPMIVAFWGIANGWLHWRAR